MHELMDRLVAFFVDHTPSLKALFIGGPPSLIWAFLCLYFSGWLKIKKGLKTGYSRKTFHFLIFTTVAVLQAVWGTSVVCLFGGMTSLVVFYAVFRGSGNWLYEAMAREKDAPHRTYFILAPYFATLIGGIVSNVLVGPIALVGYLVTGFGDAIGEPVGTRFGKHTYTVPSLKRVKAKRSYEGSAAVFIACLVAIVFSIVLCPELSFTPSSLYMIFLLGLGCALVEAVSPHGWDNATMQIIPSLLARYIL
jgi:phytol kinase